MNAFRQPVRGFPLRAALLACLLVCGCVHPRLPLMPDMSLAGIDTGPLRDKVIAIDPGHGGPERGAVGARGITEAESNLTVALHLWGLLQQAGARPVLTRSADQALGGGDLPRDLALRSGLASGADLFVSIHHNAALDRGVNSLIVFYAMADPYQSRDAARAVGAALQRRLGRESHSVQPGNYTVLRSGRFPAILGEASFISNRENELELAFARALAAEARGYFDGILDYFSRGAPMVLDIEPATPVTDDARPVIRACLDPGLAGAQVERSSITATLNGTALRQGASAQSCPVFTAPELPNGRHRACVAFRNSLGNAARRCADITVDMPPRSIALTSSFAVIPPDPAAFTGIDILVLDRLGRPVIDGTPVAISTTAGKLLQADAATVNGHARAVLAAEARPGTAALSASAGSARGSLRVLFAVPAAALLSVAVRDAAGRPLSGAALVSDARALGRSDSHGYIQVEAPAGERRFQVVKQGYEPCALTLAPAVGSMTGAAAVLEPVDAGVFFNRTVMLDPEGSSLSALPVLEALRERIEHAGGRALFTWQALPAPAYPARVMQAAGERADVFLCVSAEGRRCRAGHYHRSTAGQDLAQRLRRAFDARGLTGFRQCAVHHSTHAAVIHTPMPTLELELPRRLAEKDPEGAAQAMYEALHGWLQARHRPAPLSPPTDK